MKKIPLILFVFSVFLAGCTVFQVKQPPKPPLEMLKSATENTRKILSSRSDGVFDLSVVTKEGSEAKNFNGHANLKLAVDMNDPKSSAFQVDLDGSFQSNSKSGPLTFSVQATTDNEAIYLKLEKLTGLESELSGEIQKNLVGQWWKIPLEPQALERFVNDLKNAQNAPDANKEAENVENQNISGQILTWQNLFSNPANIQNVTYEGIVSGKAGGSYRYIFVPGKPFFDALKASFRGTAALPIPGATGELPSDLKDMEAFFDALTAKAEMWVTVDREMTSKMVLDLKADKVKDSKGLESDLVFRMDLESYDFGTKLTLEKPTEFKVFDPKAFLSGMATGGV